MRKFALLDGDIILYRAAVKSLAQLLPIYDFIDKTVQEWTIKSELKDSFICLSPRDCSNFRKRLYPRYKSQRPEKPSGYWDLYEHCTKHYPTRSRNFLEADDLMGLIVTDPRYSESVLVSVDKDLDTLPGLHVNPDKSDGVYRISPQKADYWWRFQTLTGDASDNYPGCPQVGKLRAERLLAVEDSWGTVFNTFTKAGQTRADTIMQARMARLLRYGDVQLKPGNALEVKLWNPEGGEWIML